MQSLEQFYLRITAIGQSPEQSYLQNISINQLQRSDLRNIGIRHTHVQSLLRNIGIIQSLEKISLAKYLHQPITLSNLICEIAALGNMNIS